MLSGKKLQPTFLWVYRLSVPATEDYPWGSTWTCGPKLPNRPAGIAPCQGEYWCSCNERCQSGSCALDRECACWCPDRCTPWPGQSRRCEPFCLFALTFDTDVKEIFQAWSKQLHDQGIVFTAWSKVIYFWHTLSTPQLLVESVLEVELWCFGLHWFQFDGHVFIGVKIFSESQFSKVSASDFLADSEVWADHKDGTGAVWSWPWLRHGCACAAIRI